MADAKRSLIELRAYSRRGDIYRWLRENYERVTRDVAGLQRTWESIAADVARDGVKGMRGRAPYGESVRRIWARVRRDVEAEKQREAAEAAERRERELEMRTGVSRKKEPRDFPRDWSPPLAGPETSGQLPATFDASREKHPSGPVGELGGSLARMKRVMAGSSGYGPKMPLSDVGRRKGPEEV